MRDLSPQGITSGFLGNALQVHSIGHHVTIVKKEHEHANLLMNLLYKFMRSGMEARRISRVGKVHKGKTHSRSYIIQTALREGKEIVHQKIKLRIEDCEILSLGTFSLFV